MRTLIAIVLTASLALSAAPVTAQETNAANVTNATEPAPATDANMTAAVPPADANMAVTNTIAAPADTPVAAEPVAAPRPVRDKVFPWGLLGLLGLVGLLGRRRSD